MAGRVFVSGGPAGLNPESPVMNRELSPWTGLPGQSLFGRDPLTTFQRQMDRVFEDYFRPPEARSFASVNNHLYPTLDVRETDKAYEIAAELPGIDRKDVEVKLHDNILTIRGEKRMEHRGEDGGRTYAERAYGRFERVIPLDAEVAADKVEAHFKNGVLELTLPKDPVAHDKTRRIEIRG